MFFKLTVFAEFAFSVSSPGFCYYLQAYICLNSRKSYVSVLTLIENAWYVIKQVSQDCNLSRLPDYNDRDDCGMASLGTCFSSFL